MQNGGVAKFLFIGVNKNMKKEKEAHYIDVSLQLHNTYRFINISNFVIFLIEMSNFYYIISRNVKKFEIIVYKTLEGDEHCKCGNSDICNLIKERAVYDD